MDGGLDTEFDLNRRFFVNDEAQVGCNEIRKIDLRYELGPGLGIHLLRSVAAKLNTSAGLNYQAEYDSDGSSDDALYLRLAQDFNWRLNHRLSLDENWSFSRC